MVRPRKDLALHIERALQRKQERHDGVGMEQPERPMWRIGGIIWDF